MRAPGLGFWASFLLLAAGALVGYFLPHPWWVLGVACLAAVGAMALCRRPPDERDKVDDLARTWLVSDRMKGRCKR